MEIEGKIIKDLPLTEGVGKASGKAWKKKEWVLETINTQYPRQIHFIAFNNAVDNLANLQVGKVYSVSVDAESREFNGRWYTDLRAYAYREVQPGSDMQQQQAPADFGGNQFAAQSGGGFQQPPMPVADSSDDLPF